MSTELATVDNTNLGGLPAVADKDEMFSQFTHEGAFLPRIQLYSGRTKLVSSGKMPINNYGLIKEKDKVLPLGEKIVVFPLSYRYRAMDFSVKGKVKSSFDPKSDVFKAIMKEADKDVPKGEMSNAVYGVEFLLYLKDHGYVTLLCGSKSWKGVAPTIRGILLKRKFMTLSSFHKDIGAYAWQNPEALVYPGTFDLPSVEELTVQIEKFTGTTGTFEVDGDLEGDVVVEGVTPSTDNARVR